LVNKFDANKKKLEEKPLKRRYLLSDINPTIAVPMVTITIDNVNRAALNKETDHYS
jgi:hypothetical protein